MEFVEGETLENLIRRSDRLEVELALEIATQVASGWAAVHKQKLVHRDIKPSNIGREVRTLEYYSIRSSRPAKISTMRILLNIHIPHDPFNAAVKDGTAGQKLGRIVDEIKPEAVYFTEQHGQRGAVLIVEMSDPSKIPALAEPWFLTFNANVEFRVVMTPDDLKKAGLDEIGKKWA